MTEQRLESCEEGIQGCGGIQKLKKAEETNPPIEPLEETALPISWL